MAAFIVQHNYDTIHSYSQMVVAHSSYDAEMQAIHVAIEYLTQHVTGPANVFVDNQATLKSLFNTKLHSAFELALANCKLLGGWLMQSLLNLDGFRAILALPLTSLPIKPPTLP